jgi:hypothetical protein
MRGEETGFAPPPKKTADTLVRIEMESDDAMESAAAIESEREEVATPKGGRDKGNSAYLSRAFPKRGHINSEIILDGVWSRLCALIPGDGDALTEFRRHSVCPEFLAIVYETGEGNLQYLPSHVLRHCEDPLLISGRWPADVLIAMSTRGRWAVEDAIKRWQEHKLSFGKMPDDEPSMAIQRTETSHLQYLSDMAYANIHSQGGSSFNFYSKQGVRDYAKDVFGVDLKCSAFRVKKATQRIYAAFKPILVIRLSRLRPETIFFMCDEWAGPDQVTFYGIIVGGFDEDWIFRHYCVALRAITGKDSPNAETFAKLLEKVMKEFNIQRKGMIIFVGDRAAVNPKTATLCGWRFWGCQDHMINGQIGKVLENAWVAGFLRTILAFNTVALRSGKWKRFAQVCEEEGVKVKSWRSAAMTRWGSYLMLLKAQIHNRAVAEVCLHGVPPDYVVKALESMRKEFCERTGLTRDQLVAGDIGPDPRTVPAGDVGRAGEMRKRVAEYQRLAEQIREYNASVAELNERTAEGHTFELNDDHYALMATAVSFLEAAQEGMNVLSRGVPGTPGMALAVQHFIDLQVLKMLDEMWKGFAPRERIQKVCEANPDKMGLSFENEARLRVARCWFREGRVQFDRQFEVKQESQKFLLKTMWIAALTNAYSTREVFRSDDDYRRARDMLLNAMLNVARSAAPGGVEIAEGSQEYARVVAEMDDYLDNVKGRTSGDPGGLIEDPRAAFSFESRVFWMQREIINRMPLVATVALNHDHWPATSIMIEQTFAHAKYIDTKERNRLGLETVEVEWLSLLGQDIWTEAYDLLTKGKPVKGMAPKPTPVPQQELFDLPEIEEDAFGKVLGVASSASDVKPTLQKIRARRT